MRRVALFILLLAAAAAPREAAGQPRCPGAAGPDAEAGWAALRAGDVAGARARFVAALEACPGDPYATNGLGYVALREGARADARRAFRQVVEVRPDDVDALLGLGILAWWEADLGEAGARFRRVVGLDPANATALEYLGRIEAAAALGPPPVEAESVPPRGAEAAVGLGGSLIRAGDTRGAVEAFREALAADPASLAALVGLGRALTWGGRLVEGEETLRRARTAGPRDVDALVALAQNLRWQGRNVAALEALEEAARLDPYHGDVKEQRAWVDASLSSQVRPAITAEWDSEDNRMVTAALSAALRPAPRLTLRADAYRRWLDVGPLSRWSGGVTVAAAWDAEPGWTVSWGLGGSRSDGSGRRSRAAWTASLSSPRRNAVSGTVSATSGAFDATAPLVERGVRVTEATATGQWAPTPRWRLEASAGMASFRGSGDNLRTSASASASGRVGRPWTLGAGVRAFGFREDLPDGYFDPGFFGIAELSARWMHEPGRWSLVAEVAPAIQQVGRDGDPAGAVRAAVRVSWRLAPGRELVLSGGVSSTGLQSFSTGGSDYRYRALGVGGAWVF